MTVRFVNVVALFLDHILKACLEDLADLFDNWLNLEGVSYWHSHLSLGLETRPERDKTGFEVLVVQKLVNKLVGYLH